MPDVDSHDGATIFRRIYEANPTGAEVVFQGANGGGHTWPGSADMSLALPVGATSQDINATQVTWDFLKTQARRH